MTVKQLQNYGIVTNSWISLYNSCSGILLSNDGSFNPTKATYQYYFDSSNNLVFIRHTKGDISDIASEKKVIINIDGKEVYTTICDFGVNDKTVGRYHEVFDMNEITLIR